jgi:hypothetical protein
LHHASAIAAQKALHRAGHDGVPVESADFFGMEPTPVYDAVVGNPPYVRYQDFSGEVRRRAQAAALRAGVRLSSLASSWAAFTVHAALFLRPAGRLALVLPAELLSVNYAAEVRRFLMRRFARVRLVLFTERVFPGVLEEVVLLLAEGEGPTDHCDLYQIRDVDELDSADIAPARWCPDDPKGKWTPALLGPRALAVYGDLLVSGQFVGLQAWGETTLGAVTGNNNFFTLTSSQVIRRGLAEDELCRLSPPGSRHLRRLEFTRGDWDALAARDARTWLFRPDGNPSAAAQAYIVEGERQGVHTAYKCRIRDPWWETPLVPPADLLLTYMNADTPRLVTNAAGVYHLNSVHGVYLDSGLSDLGRRLLPLASLNSMTLLGAETVGRAYGGGMLKLEPREADLLPVPCPALLQQASDRLESLRPKVGELLGRRKLLDAVKAVDEVILGEIVRLGHGEAEALWEAHLALAARRAARGRSSMRQPELP